MISYSDFILSYNPWAFCRLDDPVGYATYLDSSGNKNHLKFDLDTMKPTNRQSISLVGEPFAAGIKPNSQTQSLKIDYIDFDIPESALHFNVPQFKSETIFYRRREKIQNNLVIQSLWVDFLIDISDSLHYDYIKNWWAPIYAYENSKMTIDNLITNEIFETIEFVEGTYLESNLLQKKCLYTINETFIRLGSLAFVGATGVHYDYDGTYLGYSYKLIIVTQVFKNNEWVNHVLWKRTLVTVDPINDPAEPLSSGTHRFTIGVLNPSITSLTVKISIDGETPESVTFVPEENEFLTEYNHDVYSCIAMMNNTTFSNFSVFFNQPYPSNDWLIASQLALTKTYNAPIAEDISILSSQTMIEKLPGSLLNTFNNILIFGSHQQVVSEITPVLGNGDLTIRIEPTISGISLGDTIKINENKQSPFSGCWKINSLISLFSVNLIPALLTKIPSSVTYNAIDYDLNICFTNKDYQIDVETKNIHHFSNQDLITLHHLTDSVQNHSWIITASDANGFDVKLQNELENYTFLDNCLIKKTPIGGGCWTKTYSENKIGFGYKNLIAQQKNILIDDRELYYSKIYLSASDNSNPSESLFILKDIKNSLNREKTRFPFKVVGDCHRFYCFLPSKQNTASHTSIIVCGEVFDWFNQDWCSVAIVSTLNAKDQNIGFNYAFLYPSWSIEQETGYLICRSFETHPSDGLIKIVDENDFVTSSLGYADSGQHVYPINIPHITFNP